MRRLRGEIRWRVATVLVLAGGVGVGALAAEPEPLAEPERVPYEALGPSERRGRTIDLDELEAKTGPPSFGGQTHDLEEFSGESHALDALSRPPGPRPPKAPGEELEVPAPLKLRRLPGDGPGDDAPLAMRLCDADRERTFATRELRDAVAAYKRARRSEYPRGDAKWLVVERRDRAVRHAARAGDDWQHLMAEAEAQAYEYDATRCAR